TTMRKANHPLPWACSCYVHSRRGLKASGPGGNACSGSRWHALWVCEGRGEEVGRPPTPFADSGRDGPPKDQELLDLGRVRAQAVADAGKGPAESATGFRCHEPVRGLAQHAGGSKTE